MRPPAKSLLPESLCNSLQLTSRFSSLNALQWFLKLSVCKARRLFKALTTAAVSPLRFQARGKQLSMWNRVTTGHRLVPESRPATQVRSLSIKACNTVYSKLLGGKKHPCSRLPGPQTAALTPIWPVISCHGKPSEGAAVPGARAEFLQAASVWWLVSGCGPRPLCIVLRQA